MRHKARAVARHDSPRFPILYFGNDWDAEARTSNHQMALRLSAHVDLVYVECPGLRRPSGSARDLRKLVDKLRKTLRGSCIAGKTRVYTLFQLPFQGNALARQGAVVRSAALRVRPPLVHETHPGVLSLFRGMPCARNSSLILTMRALSPGG